MLHHLIFCHVFAGYSQYHLALSLSPFALRALLFLLQNITLGIEFVTFALRALLFHLQNTPMRT
ncbi:hypothetical protein HanIR_Chr15g0747221 [Helianthus annuus]|nr:hypothetical protein HanIR_Chr15g0747221 [Helianthus annuus]